MKDVIAQSFVLQALTLDGLTPNESMKRTSLTVTFFACAKKVPAAIGRLSWCYKA